MAAALTVELRCTVMGMEELVFGGVCCVEGFSVLCTAVCSQSLTLSFQSPEFELLQVAGIRVLYVTV